MACAKRWQARCALIMFLCWLGAAHVEAHTHLKTSVPAGGSTVEAVAEVRLRFAEEIEAPLSYVTIQAKGGAKIAGNVVSDPADRKVLILKLGAPLTAGVYTVHWRIVSADTHKVKGSFTFRVRP